MLDGPVAGLLADVALQARNADRGVFAWNIEGYSDVQSPPPGFQGPISTLYTVTAGFKPNMILNRHGMDESTRVVFFDYSAPALAFKKLQIERWDGMNFPDFFRDALTELRPLKPYYQLWDGASEDGLDWREVEEKWKEELAVWGGGPAFREHWQAFRRLEHDFVLCDIWTQPRALLAKLQDCPSGVIWWSNAFFTMARNWRYSLEAKRQIYEEWIRALRETAPRYSYTGRTTTASASTDSVLETTPGPISPSPVQTWSRFVSNGSPSVSRLETGIASVGNGARFQPRGRS